MFAALASHPHTAPQLNIQTAGDGGMPEMQVAFLAAPEQAREAIQLAVKLTKDGVTAAPTQQAMGRAGVKAPTGSLHARLECLTWLVDKAVLDAKEAAQLKVAVLASEHDPLARLVETVGLRDKQLISDAEMVAVKNKLVAQILQA